MQRNIGQAEVEQICAETNLTAFVESFPEGLQTQVDASELRLSGGEQRLLAFLRCLVTRPAVIVLDEPTASLSEHHAVLLIEAIDNCRKAYPESTRIIFTHDARLMDIANKMIRLGEVA